MNEYSGILLIIGLLSVCGIVLIAIKAQKKSIEQREKEYNNELFQRYLTIAESVVETTVIKLNETVVKEYKKEDPGGKLTPDRGEQVFDMAIRNVKLILGSVFIEFIACFIGNFDEWLKQEIEKYVSVCKVNYNVNDLYNDLKKEGILK